MNRIEYIESIEQFPKDNIIIYGSGDCGNIVFNILKDININAVCYVVSDGHVDKLQHNGIPVYELSKLPYKYESCNIILATAQPFYVEILNNINNEHFRDVRLFGFRNVTKMFRMRLENYFEKNNIDINKPTIRIKDWEIENVFQIDNECTLAFFAEIGDCVFPSIAKDYSEINEGSYEYEGVKLEYGDIIFDCGANIGLFSSVAASKGCYVYAFEPLKNIVEVLEKVCFKYKDSIQICLYALCDYVGSTNFKVDNENFSGSKLLENNSPSSIQVNTTTIDNFVRENNIRKLDFIKADIEGAERLMLKGAKNTLATLAPKLAICTYHLQDDPEVLENLIKEANPNYIVKHKWKKLFAYVPK